MAFLEELKKGITDVSESIARKSTKVMEIQKLKMKKSSIESDMKKNYVLLGQAYFVELEESESTDETVNSVFRQIVDAKAAVAEIQAKLEKLSKEKVCSVCGEKSAKDMSYCPYCGAKFEELKAEDAAVCEEDEVIEEVETNNEASEMTEESDKALDAQTDTLEDSESKEN